MMMPNWIEWVMVGAAALLLMLYFKLARYSRRQMLLHTLALLPFLCFSVNMLTQAMAVDDPGYLYNFVYPENIKYNFNFAMKVLYQYKFSQLTIVPLFAFIQMAQIQLFSLNSLCILYRILRYFLLFGMALLTVAVWRLQIFENREEKRLRISESILLAMLVSLPLSCLLLKLANYDATSTYPALLGFSLLWGAYKTGSVKQGLAATVITFLGVLEKYTALPYWCICVILFAHLAAQNKSRGAKMLSGAAAIGGAYGAALGISFLDLVFARWYQHGLVAPINWGNVTFSLTHAARAVLCGDMSVNREDPSAYNGDAARYLIIVAAAMAFCFLLLEGILALFKAIKRNPTDFLAKLFGTLIPVFVLAGIVGAYLVPLRVAPPLEIQDGFYQSTDYFGGWTYHYGARTAVGHTLYKIAFMCATVFSCYPTVVTAATVLLAVLMWRKKIPDIAGNRFANIFWVSSVLLLALYAAAGLPPEGRYYSLPIYVLVFVVLYYWEQFYRPQKGAAAILLAGCLLFAVEMQLYAPNVCDFAPIWIQHTAEHNETVRVGEWYAGESMIYGQQIAMGGKKIKARIDRERPGTDYSTIKIYYDYPGVWLKTWRHTPAFSVLPLDASVQELSFDENSYYILNRFRLFSRGVPSFIYDVEPIDTVSFRGEIGAWIYRGDQLADYRSYFEELIK